MVKAQPMMFVRGKARDAFRDHPRTTIVDDDPDDTRVIRKGHDA